MGVLKAYGGVEVHIHFILKSALYGFQWLASRRNQFNAAEALWAPQADLRVSQTGKISDHRRESNCAKQPVVLKECRYVLNVAAITLREVATYIQLPDIYKITAVKILTLHC